MSGWLLVFMIQTILAAKRDYRWHRVLGEISVVLGILVFISMGIVTFHALLGFPPNLDNLSWDILLLQMCAMILFGLLFAFGILLRKNAAAHKRLLLVATLVLLQAGIGRIQWLPPLAIGNPSFSGIPNPAMIFLYLDILLIPLFIYDCVVLKRIHKTTIIAALSLTGVQFIIVMLWSHLV